MRRAGRWMLCALVLLVGCGPEKPRETNESPSSSVRPGPEGAREVILTFGQRLQRVSLLAPPRVLEASLRSEYAELVTPELLEGWVHHPDLAPGRRTSSPWPDHIEIGTMEQADSALAVDGAVVEMTSAGPAGRTPVRIELAQREGRWRITSFQEQSDPEGTVEDREAALDVIRSYYAAITERRYRDAYALWSSGGQASGKTFEQFQAGFSNTAAAEVALGTAGPIGAAAGSRYLDVPVRISARSRDGKREEFSGTYTLRRSVVDGATAEQRAWRIYSADVHEQR